MADNSDRNSKAAKRQRITPIVDSHNKSRTYVHDPTHIAYVERDFPVSHLTRKARAMLGFDPNYSALDS